MKNLRRNLLIFNTIFLIYGFVILFTNIMFQNYLIDFDNKCEIKPKELLNSLEMAEYSLIILIGIGSFNLILALNGIYAVLIGDSCLLYTYGVLLFLLFAVELITIAIILATFKNLGEYADSYGKSDNQFISNGFFGCILLLGSITTTVAIIQILAVSNGCTLAERLRMRSNDDFYIDSEYNQCIKEAKIYFI